MSLNPIYQPAITRAYQTSKRASIGWAILDRDQQLLKYGANMAGLDDGRLAGEINNYQHEADTLFLSSDPTGYHKELSHLLNSISNSAITRLSIGQELNLSPGQAEWQDWRSQWDGTIHTEPRNNMVDNLSAGIRSLHRVHRPWVTCIVAADLAGKPRELTTLLDAFDFLNLVSSTIKQSRGVLVAPSQWMINNRLPEINHENESLIPYKVDNLLSIKTLFSVFAREYRCSATILADTELLAKMLEEDMVDEIIYHIVNDASAATITPQKKHTELQLFNWQPVDSAVIGTSNRIIYRKKNLRTPLNDKDLGYRLN